MTKKIFAMFLAVLMVVSMLPTSVFAAEKTCPGKGNHTALNCNNTVLGVTEPTCKAPGFTAYKCNDCEEEFHDNVTPATGAHTYVDAPDKAPTCEEPGKQGLKVCSGCGDEVAATIIPSLSNGKYNCQWEITNPQINCLTGGEQIWKCVNCGAEKTVKIDKKAEHKWGEFKLVTAATATTNGKAVRVCDDCGAEDEVVVFAAHECALIYVAKLPATCTTDGMDEHYVCRICGAIYGVYHNDDGTFEPRYNPYDAAGIEKYLVLKAGHTYECPEGCQMTDEHGNGKEHVATCVDTVLHCLVCDQTVAANVAHEYESDKSKWEVGADATCIKSGYIWAECENCGVAKTTEILPALGHKTVEVTVPATCATYAYTYTFCTRSGCDAKVVTEEANADYALALGDNRYNLDAHKFGFNYSAPVVDTEYYMALNQKTVGTVLYFTGNASGNYLETSHDARNAVKVYVEKVHLLDKKGEFLLYFYNDEDVKTYISVEGYTYYDYKSSGYKAGGKVVLSTTAPSTVWTWDTDNTVLTTTVKCYEDWYETFFLCAYNSFETIGASLIKYAPSYSASLVDTEATHQPKLYKFTMNKDAGVNAENHGSWTYEVVTAATCTTNGVKMATCAFCGDYHEESIPAAHSWVNATDDQVPGKTEKAAQAVGCVDGWQWMICSVQGCGETKKVTYTGSGHVYGDVVEFEPNHINTTGNDTKTCKYCGDVVKLTYRVWEFIGVQFDSLADAKEAHGETSLSPDKVLSVGDCNTTGLTRYTCSGCEKSVLVKTEGKHTPEASINGIPVYKAPTCTEKGWMLTYKCTECDEIVGAAAYGEKNEIAALGHDYELVDEDHECNDCDDPAYTDVHKVCTRCTEESEGHYIYCFVKNEEISFVTDNANKLCELTVIEYYWCEKCQDEHIRNFVEAMDHEWKPVTKLDEKGNVIIDYITPPSCIAGGKYTEKCAICGETRDAFDAPIAHENKAGEKFFNKCTDTVTDRHCKNCCACVSKGASHDCVNNKNAAGQADPCDCVIKTEHQYNSVKMPSTCSMPPYLAKVCPDCGDRKNEVQTEVNGEKVIFGGHKPAAIDKIPEIGADGKPTGKMVEVKYPGFTYAEYTYVWYTVKDGEWVKNTETYMAKFIERKAASYTEEGYDLSVCQICKTEEKNIIAKLTGLGFEVDVKNANGDKEFTYGSLVEVTISANGNNVAFNSFDFNLLFGAALKGECELHDHSADCYERATFCENTAEDHEHNSDCWKWVCTNKEHTHDGNCWAQALICGKDVHSAHDLACYMGLDNLVFVYKDDSVNKDFNITVTNAKDSSYYVNVLGSAVRNESGKQQNITINGKTALVKLYFRVKAEKAAAIDFMFNDAKLYEIKNSVTTKVTEWNAVEKTIKTRTFLDFNNDGYFTPVDLIQAESMMTFEHPAGKTYDVTLDLNKDGEVTPEELTVAYNYFVGNYDATDLLVMGMSEAEIALLNLNEKAYCNSSACGKEIDADAVYCPFCGNHQ